MLQKAWIGSPTYLLAMICMTILPQAANQRIVSGDVQMASGYYVADETLIHPQTGALVLAAVNDVPIYDVEVERYLQQMDIYDDLSEMSLRVYRSTVLSQLVRRQVILSHLLTTEWRASEQEIDLAVSEVKSELEARGQTLEKFLESGKSDSPMLRRHLAWNIVWTRYLKSYLTEANLRRYYDRHYEQFDGTSRHVAQVFLGNPADPTNFVWDSAFREAVFLRDKIQRGELSFEQAVREQSNAPSAQDGGDMGWVTHDGPLDPKIHEAVFSRQVGDLVGPIQSKFGIHLLKILEEKRGDRPWKEMEPEIREAAASYLFSHMADRYMTDASVLYFGDEESGEFDPEMSYHYQSGYPGP